MAVVDDCGRGGRWQWSMMLVVVDGGGGRWQWSMVVVVFGGGGGRWW